MAVVTCTCRTCSKGRVILERIFDVLDTIPSLLNLNFLDGVHVSPIRNPTSDTSRMVFCPPSFTLFLENNESELEIWRIVLQDFFQEQLWEKLPNSWRNTLQTVSPDDVGKWLAGDLYCSHVWPLSLFALRQVAKSLQLNRDHQNGGSAWRCEKNLKCNSDNSLSGIENKLYSIPVSSGYDNLFLKHVKLKKRHEIQQIARICADCAQDTNTECIVDVGAGVGHLARSLAFKHGLHVTCIEQDALLSQQARRWDNELITTLSKRLPDLSVNIPQHVSIKLENVDFDQSRTVEDIRRVFSDNFTLEKGSEFGIVGLHPCGDLAATLLRFYASRCEARFICIVGCCYMKLTLESPRDGLHGYPLSKYLSSFAKHKLSYTSLEVACHAIENYCDKLKTGNYDDLIVHAYRAALETILIKRSSQLRRTQVKNVKVTKYITFEQYCAAATADFESNFRPDDSDFRDPQIKSYLEQWRQIVIFGALRAMLAPLVETVVLLDRFLYLSENDLAPVLKPIFDPKLSPRNFLLFSVKSAKQS